MPCNCVRYWMVDDAIEGYCDEHDRLYGQAASKTTWDRLKGDMKLSFKTAVHLVRMSGRLCLGIVILACMFIGLPLFGWIRWNQIKKGDK